MREKIESFQTPELERLKSIEGIDLKRSFRVEREVDEEGNPVDGEVFWIRLNNEEQAVEGKLYLSERENGELVIMEPGVPGDGVILFDKRHAPNLVKEGYNVFVARHNGLVIDSTNSEKYLQCPQKREHNQQVGDEIIGNEFRVETWEEEGLTAIRSLEKDYQKIHLIGHSFGAYNLLATLRKMVDKNPELVDKIESFISLSGSVGKIREDGKVDPDGLMTLERIKGYFEYMKDNDLYRGITPEENINQFRGGNAENYSFDYLPFQKTRFFFMAPTKILGGRPDEYNPISASQEMADYLKSQVKTIRVAEYKTVPTEEYEAHDFEHLSSTVLLNWLDKVKAKKIVERL